MHAQHLSRIAEINRFSTQGRIGVQTRPNGFSGSLQWQHTPERDDIALFSPLGGQVASIEKTMDAVRLSDGKGNIITEKDAETLTQNTLGWQLPLRGLSDWVLGRPSASQIESRQWDAEGRLISLVQDGWKIDYVEYHNVNHYSLPSKLNLHHPQVNIKFILQEMLIDDE